MLHTLELRDFAIVDELELDLAEGLNVLTGETGAGKSIVVDALELLSGGRPDAAMIRTGAEAALVQATFEAAPLASASRRVAANGRHGARLNGELVSVAELAEAVGAQVQVFGQHSAVELLSPSSQREQLDRLLPAADAAVLDRHRSAFAELQAATKALERLEGARLERLRRLDTLAFELQEIDSRGPRLGEDERLSEELAALQHAERVMLAGAAAFAALGGEDENAVSFAAAALRELEGVGRYAPALAALARDLRELVSGLSAVSAEVEGFLSDFQADPQRLDDVQARLATLEALKRKYGPDLAAVLAYRDAAAAEVAALGGADEEILRLQAESSRLTAELDGLATRLTAAREAAGAALAAGVLPLLNQLGLPKATFAAVVRPAARPGKHGNDEVSFEFSANPGEPRRRVADVASGGELSRIMLALHLVTGSDLSAVVFDEVDAGVAGATANHVGALLARLATKRQVLVVTHLAQVAAFADAHFKVEKVQAGARTVVRVQPLAPEERIAELARLLSGTLTDTSLRHAGELLERARATVLPGREGTGRARARHT